MAGRRNCLPPSRVSPSRDREGGESTLDFREARTRRPGRRPLPEFTKSKFRAKALVWTAAVVISLSLTVLAGRGDISQPSLSVGVGAIATAPVKLLTLPVRLSGHILRGWLSALPSASSDRSIAVDFVYAKIGGNSTTYHICRKLPPEKGHSSTNLLRVECGGKIYAVEPWNVKKAGPEMPLLVAASMGDLAAANRTLMKGGPVDGADPHGRTALYCAACEGRIDIINLLLNAGADVNRAQEQNATPLFVTCQMGHDGACRLLLRNGADLRIATKLGATPLHVAAQYGHEPIVKRLLQAGANPNELLPNGVTPLYVAAQMGHTGVVRLLLESGASAKYQIPSVQSATALFVAAQRGHVEVVKLLARDTTVDQPTSDSMVTPLLVAAEMGYPEVVTALIAQGADVNWRSKEGCTPLSQACIQGHEAVVKELLEAGADPNIAMATADGPAPLYWAAKHGHAPIVRLLISCGADLDRPTKRSGRTALQTAIQAGHSEVAQILMDAGALTPELLQGSAPGHSASNQFMKKFVDPKLVSAISLHPSGQSSRRGDRGERSVPRRIRTVKFNVGGTVFEISTAILQRHPRSLLTALSQKPSASDEPIFVERSPERFPYVLDWLRDGHVTVPPAVSREALLRDLKFFQLRASSSSVVFEAPALGFLASRQGELHQRSMQELANKMGTLKRKLAALDVCRKVINTTVLEMNRGKNQINFYPDEDGPLSSIMEYIDEAGVRERVTQILYKVGVSSDWIWNMFTRAPSGWSLRVDATKQVPDSARVGRNKYDTDDDTGS